MDLRLTHHTRYQWYLATKICISDGEVTIKTFECRNVIVDIFPIKINNCKKSRVHSFNSLFLNHLICSLRILYNVVFFNCFCAMCFDHSHYSPSSSQLFPTHPTLHSLFICSYHVQFVQLLYSWICGLLLEFGGPTSDDSLKKTSSAPPSSF